MYVSFFLTGKMNAPPALVLPDMTIDSLTVLTGVSKVSVQAVPSVVMLPIRKPSELAVVVALLVPVVHVPKPTV